MSTNTPGPGSNPPPAPTATTIPRSGDGKTAPAATWSQALYLDSSAQKTYVVNSLGLSPQYRRTTLVEARSFAQVYTILDGDTYEIVYQLPAGPMVNQAMPAATGTAQQIAGIQAHEATISTGSGHGADQYNAAQAHHGDAFIDTDNDGEGDSNSRGTSAGSSN